MKESYYWHVGRRTNRVIPWVARKLPRRIKYYVVIDGMVTVEPLGNPSDVSGMQLLKLWES